MRVVGPAILTAVLAGAVLAPAATLASGAPPVPVNDTLQTLEGVVLHANVLANDTDPESDPLQVTSYLGVAPAYGTLTVAASGDLTFTPAAGFFGVVPQTWYHAYDGTTGVKGYIDITVNPINDPPTAVDDTLTVTEDTATDVTAGLLANDTDPEDDDLAVTAAGSATGGGVAVAGGVVTFTPTGNLCGVAAGGFDYTVSDGELSDTGHATVDITCVNDGPDAVADEVDGLEGEPTTIAVAGLLANDTDPEGDALAFVGIGGEVNGSGIVDADNVLFTADDADFCGDASFTYTVTDGDVVSDPGVVTIDIACVNDAPVAVDDTGTMTEGGSADFDVLANDTDIDGDDLSVTDVAVDAADGTATIVANRVRFVPAAHALGDAVISYTMSDGTVTDTGVLTVTVTADTVDPVPAAPTVAFGTGRVNESAPLRITWSAVDAGVGVKSYEVQARVGGGAWTTIYTGAGESVTALYGFGKDLQWQVRATDNNDNVSDWVPSAVRRLVSFQGGSPVTTTGTWKTVASSGSSGSGYRFTTTEGKSTKLRFTGLGVLYVAPRLSTGGFAKVSIDGAATRHRLKADGTTLGVIVKSRLWAASGSHTIKVSNDKGGKKTTFDAFIVLR